MCVCKLVKVFRIISKIQRTEGISLDPDKADLNEPLHLGEHCLQFQYSRLSLSRLRLSRITAYLEEKIWSLFKHRNLASGNKILWIRGEIAPQEQFLPFPTIFSISISK